MDCDGGWTAMVSELRVNWVNWLCNARECAWSCARYIIRRTSNVILAKVLMDRHRASPPQWCTMQHYVTRLYRNVLGCRCDADFENASYIKSSCYPELIRKLGSGDLYLQVCCWRDVVQVAVEVERAPLASPLWTCRVCTTTPTSTIPPQTSAPPGTPDLSDTPKSGLLSHMWLLMTDSRVH